MFWVLAPCGFFFRSEDGDSISLKRWHLPSSLHAATTEIFIIIIILTTVNFTI
jgi:hypothetical protein